MTMRSIVFFLLLCAIAISGNAYADPDDDCAGTWSIEMLKDENYTPWHAYTNNPSHPVKLELRNVRPKRALFTDNKDRKCSVMYLTDEDNGLVVFRHCLRGSFPDEIPTHYKISCKGDMLTGKIVSYKDLFKLKGVRVQALDSISDATAIAIATEYLEKNAPDIMSMKDLTIKINDLTNDNIIITVMGMSKHTKKVYDSEGKFVEEITEVVGQGGELYINKKTKSVTKVIWGQ